MEPKESSVYIRKGTSLLVDMVSLHSAGKIAFSLWFATLCQLAGCAWSCCDDECG